jgi:hypothetical protein
MGRGSPAKKDCIMTTSTTTTPRHLKSVIGFSDLSQDEVRLIHAHRRLTADQRWVLVDMSEDLAEMAARELRGKRTASVLRVIAGGAA